jgi:hypothetical protein
MDQDASRISGPPTAAGEGPVVCSLISRTTGEQLYGTAPRTVNWFLLEYPYVMGAKAFEESTFSPAVKDHFAAALKDIPNSRLLLIRRKSGTGASGVTFFAARASENEPVLYEYHYQSYEELLYLDLTQFRSGSPELETNRRQGPLFLVCTNGRRDQCCARWGPPVFEALSGAAPGSTWQCSHVGGHRFAANVLCFPYGIYYGRVDPEEVKSLVAAYQKQQLYLPRYRGRSCYSPQVQAAEFFLRDQTGVHHLDAFELVSSEEVSPGRWDIGFLSRSDGKTYDLELIGELSQHAIYESCKAVETTRQVQYRLGDLKMIKPNGQKVSTKGARQ